MFRRCYVLEMLCSEGKQSSDNNHKNMARYPNSDIILYSQIVSSVYRMHMSHRMAVRGHVMFRRCYVQKMLCSGGVIFTKQCYFQNVVVYVVARFLSILTLF